VEKIFNFKANDAAIKEMRAIIARLIKDRPLISESLIMLRAMEKYTRYTPQPVVGFVALEKKSCHPIVNDQKGSERNEMKLIDMSFDYYLNLMFA
jgi:hypothetical protein